jgi:RNA recognition motif-containing protein
VFIGPGAKKDAELLGLGLKKLTNKQKDDLERAKRYSMEISIRQVLMKQQKSHQENQLKASQMAQALSLMARVYIGSISFEVREENIRQSFSVFGPIKSLNMSYDTVTGVSFPSQLIH